MSKKVIAAGHICLDITPVFPEQKAENITDVLQPGKLIEMGIADVHTGGAVANTGLGMKILGADVSLMGKIGKDAFGDMVLSILQKYGAAEGMIRSEKEATSYTVALAIPGIDRIFLHNPGANHSFCAEDIPMEALQQAALFHFGYPPLMRSMYENEGAELLAVLKKAKQAGCATSLDLAAVDAGSEAGKADWKRILQKVIPYVDFFVPSAEELCFMLDRPRFVKWQERAKGKDVTKVIDMEKDIKPLARMCMAYGAKVLLLKCGVSGMYYCTAGEEKIKELAETPGLCVEAWADQEGFEKSYVPEKVLSGTGAGDTSIAAFLTAMLEGNSLEECMHLAAAQGASCVAAYDALSGLKPLDELRKKIAAGWEKNQ
ncbi:MAG: carbohydrate kinase family protein [Lachnospiraceae bacterium]|nr:carbohydrate kinase family protein [Lachnospiraceae bacterium]